MVHMLELKGDSKGDDAVAIALLVISKEQALSYVKKLKRYQIANRDAGKNVVTLLADFPTQKPKSGKRKKEIIEAIKAELDALNKNSDNPFGLICRPRVENAADGMIMGWERKRGAVCRCSRLSERAKASASATESAGDYTKSKSTSYASTAIPS